MKRIKLFETFKKDEKEYYYYLVKLDSGDDTTLFCEVEENLTDDFEEELDNFSDITIFSYENVAHSDDWDYFQNYVATNNIKMKEQFTINNKNQIKRVVTKMWYALPKTK